MVDNFELTKYEGFEFDKNISPYSIDAQEQIIGFCEELKKISFI